MRAKQLELALKTLLPNKRNILIKGQPGIGKSELVEQACFFLNYDLLIFHPVVSDPTDFKGLPWVIIAQNGEHEAVFTPLGDLKKLLTAKKPLVAFFDDIGQATPAVQSALMQVFLAGQINGHKISEHVRFVAATNRREDRANVSGLLTSLRSRFHSIVELDVDVKDPKCIEEWVEWAYKHGTPPEVISFIQFRPHMLNDFKATRDIENYPCPRTVYFLGQMWNDGIPEDIQFEIIKGAVGETFAVEFLAYIKVYMSLPSIHQIIHDPTTVSVPTEISAKFALTAMIVDKMDTKTIDPLVIYLKRMEKELYVSAMKNAATKNPEICSTRAFTSFAIEHGYELSDVA